MPLPAAVGRYLDSIQVAATRACYAETLGRLVDVAGPGRPVCELTPEDYAAVMLRWDGAAAATWNRHLSALGSFTAWAQRREILATNPARHLSRRQPARRGDRCLPEALLRTLLTGGGHALRERTLWTLLYETAGHAQAILALNVEDLDLGSRHARVASVRRAAEYVSWRDGSADLLPRLLAGRTSGPVFLTGRRAPASGSRAPAPTDADPGTGRGRLSYSRAEYLFKVGTAALDPRGRGWTLDQLRRTALRSAGQRSLGGQQVRR
ncbi:site-specific integrase [Actinomadura sp. 7K507]|uniref:tyrosine-type recombinase/integrase n=1 Tax=Actinomadura sp. 7K507 TaxID=2530365 RepID=UPI001051501F|nr:site-specific integrase [Actinomadura sp. 7K507]TDC88555.1 site-specific integrase [Actinomadura sp. 7K507]